MITLRSLLDEALESWEDARMGFIAEVENIPEDRFGFRPTPEVRSVRELLVHVLEVAMMMTGELTREDTDFRRAPWPEMLKEYASDVYEAKTKQQLLALLRSQLDDAAKRFQDAGELHLFQLIKRFDGKKGTRFAWLQHGIAHEMYHRGQLTLYERQLDIEPALTRKIKG